MVFLGLLLNVITPAHGRYGSKLPVVVVCVSCIAITYVNIVVTRLVVDIRR